MSTAQASTSTESTTPASTRHPKSASERNPGAPRLSDEQAHEVLELLRKVDTVELKVTIPLDDHRATVRGLPLDPIEGKLRQVYFFDTPDLALDRAGLVVRARRSSGGKGDTVIKLRPVEPDDLPADLRKLDLFNVEMDALPGGYVCSASFKGVSDAGRVLDGATGVLPLRKVFSKEQRDFFGAHAPAGVSFEDLMVLGPTFVLKYAFIADFGARPQRVAAELWLYPDDSRILELSLRCPPSQAFQVAQEARSYLAHRDIRIDAVGKTKTRAALTYYSSQLQHMVKPQRGRASRSSSTPTSTTGGTPS
jgi:hypothetical protein